MALSTPRAVPEHLRWLHELPIPPFVPHRALSNGHLQTVALPFVRPPDAPPGERVEIPVRGGHLVARRDVIPNTRGLAIILHGINGTSAESFVLRMARKLQRKGFDTLRLNLRGAGESMETASGLVHSGLTDDVRAVVDWSIARYDHVSMVGFSLGAQLLLRAVGEWGAAPPEAIRMAVAISAPIDLVRCSAFAERASASIYRWFIVAKLRRRYARLTHTMPAGFTRERVRWVRTIRHFDDAVIAPLHGFRDAHDYYERASASAVLPFAAVPTAIIHAADDPLVPIGPVLDAQATASPFVRFVVTEGGGHVGFLGQSPCEGDDDRFWAECRAADLVRAAP
jgi:uncharacterized protein